MLRDLSSYLASPIGRACASTHILCWFPAPALRVVALWGRLDDGDADFLTTVMSYEIGPDCGAYASLIDLRGLEHVDERTFERFLGFMVDHQELFGERIRHSALLHAGGTMAALAAGYTRLLERPFGSSLHTAPAAALLALGFTEAPTLFATLGQLVAEAQARAAMTGRVIDYARRHMTEASLPGCARALGVSERTLQRALREHATSFREELARARIERAAALLRSTDDKLFTIARAVGYPRPQNLASAFRKRTGVTPGTWRSQGMRAR